MLQGQAIAAFDNAEHLIFRIEDVKRLDATMNVAPRSLETRKIFRFLFLPVSINFASRFHRSIGQ